MVALNRDFSYNRSMMKQSIYDYPTVDLVTLYDQLGELSNSRHCPYEDWIDMQMNMEAIEEVLFERELDETSERFSQVDYLFNELMMAADWASTGPGYDEEDEYGN